MESLRRPTLEPSRCSAWLVDLDGTLYRAGPVRLAMAVEMALLGWGAILVVWRFRKEQERLRREVVAGVHDPYRLQVTRTASACDAREDHVRAIVNEWMLRRPAKWISLFRRRRFIAELLRFKAEGGRVAIVSDYPARSKLECLGLVASIDVVVANGEAATYRLKPSPDGYLEAARLLGTAAADCLVIGDRFDTDGSAAAAARMRFRLV